MREAVTVSRMVGEHALVRLVSRSILERREFSVVRLAYDRKVDWEVAVVEEVGEGFDDLSPGDHIIMRAGGVDQNGGGPAGTDVSVDLGERRGSLVVIGPDDVVSIVRLSDD